MSKLRFGIMKIVPKQQEDLANYDIVGAMFAEAYTELRKSCPKGDLHIYLFVEADSAGEVGAVLEEEK